MSEPSIRQLEANLMRHHPLHAPADAAAVVWRASVALVVRPGREALELLLIRRALRAGDPWSGHMAFPGGRREAADRDAQHTAVRETREEVGIDLEERGRLLGRLDDVNPASGGRSIIVSPFVFSVPAGTETTANAEVDRAIWMPVREISAPEAATEYVYSLADVEERRFPAIEYREHIIWGLTYRIMHQFLLLATTGADDGGTR